MGRKYNNTINFGGSFNIKARTPIDSRTVVQSLTDLVNKETWTVGDAFTPPYQGMTVSVLDDHSIYMLTDSGNDYSKSENWSKISGEGGGGGEIIIPDIKDSEGNVIVKGGTVSSVISQLVSIIEDLQDKLSNSITNIEYLGIDEDDKDIEITVTGNTAYISMNGISG